MLYEARLLWDDTVCVPIQSCQKYILLHHSLLTTHYHADTMLTSSLDVLHILWCRLVCRNFVKLNLVKTGLKSKFGVNFSHELCLYITRFSREARLWRVSNLYMLYTLIYMYIVHEIGAKIGLIWIVRHYGCYTV